MLEGNSSQCCALYDSIPAASGLDLASERLEALKSGPVLHINLLVGAPLGCDEGVVDIVYDVALPEGDYRSFGLRNVLSPHAATDIPCFQIYLLHQPMRRR